MPAQVIEGTWEEIELRKAELIGRQLRVIIKPVNRRPRANKAVGAIPTTAGSDHRVVSPAERQWERMPSGAEYTAVMSEEALGAIWDTPQEDDAWRHLQEGT